MAIICAIVGHLLGSINRIELGGLLRICGRELLVLILRVCMRRTARILGVCRVGHWWLVLVVVALSRRDRASICHRIWGGGTRGARISEPT